MSPRSEARRCGRPINIAGDFIFCRTEAEVSPDARDASVLATWHVVARGFLRARDTREFIWGKEQDLISENCREWTTI
jgi:hypothetical protein